MKILCDVCGNQEASIFCYADEAALCADCDHRIHYANKLVSKHNRFSLLSPPPPPPPPPPPSSSSDAGGVLSLCDICQEKKALIFCQQDRAILCRDCDLPIHSANDLTKKHTRFLFTGIKLSSVPDLPAPSNITTTPTASAPPDPVIAKVTVHSGGCDLVPDFKPQPLPTKTPPISLDSHQGLINPITPTASYTSINNHAVANNLLIYGGGSDTSSVSESLMGMLPGWQFDDFIAPSSAPFGFCEGNVGDLASFWDADDLDNISSSSSNNNNNTTTTKSINSVASSYENRGIWVPQTPNYNITFESPHPDSKKAGFYGFGMEKMEASRNDAVTCLQWMDDGFTVPQINNIPQTIGTKRCRTFW